MAGLVSLETETPSAPFLKGRGLGGSQEASYAHPETQGALAVCQGRASGYSEADRIMAPGAAWHVPPVRWALESWGCQLVFQGDSEKGYRDARTSRCTCLPGTLAALSIEGRKEMANSNRTRPAASFRRAQH